MQQSGELPVARIDVALARFVAWLERFGPLSLDHQSYFAGPVGRSAKALYYRNKLLGTVAVAPMVFSEAMFPAARVLFGSRVRFPIADAHYAMGFALLARSGGESHYVARAREHLDALLKSRCASYQHYCWGYPFDWVTRTGVMRAGTPLITTTPYVYEAFAYMCHVGASGAERDIMRSIAEHALTEIPDREISVNSAAAGYNPQDANGCVVNASAYRAFLLASASKLFEREDYREAAERNLNFVLESQRSDGSWCYAMDGVRDFVDHFHTCFVLKALAKIEYLTGDEKCSRAIEAGVDYYVRHLFDVDGLPRPFANAPRLTVYRHELYDYAECLNLGGLLRGRFGALDKRTDLALADLLTRWQKPDGSFRSRRLLMGWDNVPMHRWAQSQVFRSLCQLRLIASGQPVIVH